MVAPVIVVVDEALEMRFEVAGQEVVFEQDAVLERLMPALDLALRLRVARRAAHVTNSPETSLGPLSLSSRGLWTTRAPPQPDAASANCNVSVTSSAFIVVQSFQAMMEREKSSRIVDR